MQKVLRKRIWRDFKSNLPRYLALSLLIILAMYLVVSLVGAAETIIRGSENADSRQCVEDGDFSLFVPMKDEEMEDLEADGVTIEPQFYMDYEIDEDHTIRIFANRDEVNRIDLVKGTLAEKGNELVVERQFAEKNDISAGDVITFGGREFTVTGIGTTPDYDNVLKSLGDTGCDCLHFGTGFVAADVYDTLRAEEKSIKSEEYYYAYRLNGAMTDDELKDRLEELEFTSGDVEDPFFQEYWDRTMGKKDDLTDGIQELLDGAKELKELKAFEDGIIEYTDGTKEAEDGSNELLDGIQELKDETDDMIDDIFSEDAQNLMTFVKAGDNARIQAASGDQELYRSVGTIAGAILLILISYVLSVFVVHSIDQESAVIGALYALGVKRKNLMAHYVTLPTVITFVSGLIGTLLGYSSLGVPIQMQDCYNYYSLPDLDVIYMPYLFIYGIVVPPVISIIVNSLVIRKRLSKPVLTMIRNEQKVGNGKDIKLGNMSFMNLFKIRQMLRESRTGFTVVFGMFVSLLLAMMSLEIYTYCANVNRDYVNDTKYEYMYTYKYPTEEVPEGGYEAYAKTLKKKIYGYNFDITVMGLTENNPFFDVDLSDSSSKVAISSSIAYKYGLDVGDTLTLKDDEADKIYAFEIASVAQYAPSFMVFMPYDKALELFDEPEDYFNVVFSDHALDVETGRLYATTTKTDVKKAAGIFSDIMQGMILTIGGVSVLIFIVVMYLMMKVMIDRSSFNIALIKIFGYRNKEVKKMYLDGNFYIITIGALISIPLTKWIMDVAYEPAFVPNIACGIDKSFPFWMYLAIFAGILILYFIINHLLIRRIRKMVPAEVLKNRE
ncbi:MULTISPECIES: ABC transporter permease [unclassified Clostridium]|jgi:ABC-type antimicrobial peptide transport system permease subunit|uniref:ABC transporter permease n=1 Tax=unclassified Clostridium TaxID=2614128 RepID=UPI0003380E3E|nr:MULTISPECIES: ABC transporter permease [unclassified Clostridium]RHV79045.1 ABC transporter permease [Clostridium sp. OF10-22XD]CCY60997.1 efflux ABC transporter permease protein [Clostridium sp. CAG:264]RGG37464.1 ABC transporter permease [Clostridium sp. AF23-6LB]RHP91042.1 ABC transporter permease [Clostridium sp. AM54-37XD]RHP95031.1 ABC transporter permease [Clostridium sp. AM54-14XD]